MIQKCDKECFRKNKQNDPEINSTFHLLGDVYTGCTTTYIDTTNTLTHRPIQVVLCLAGLYYVLTLCCNYHAAVTGSKSFATKLLISFNQKVAKH